MSRAVVLAAPLTFAGLALLLGELRWFARVSSTERLRPYTPGGLGADAPRASMTGSLREVVAPLAQQLCTRLARLFGVTEDLATRLRRVHSPLTVSSFRTRQLGWATAAFGTGSLISVSFRPPAALCLLLIAGLPLLAFLILEQQLQAASARWQRRVFLELPVVTEQLGMLLSAGYSLGSALQRMSRRTHGAISQDLAVVCARVQHGLAEIDALQEWADLVRVDALDRLVAVLALNREAGDLGQLIAHEARSVRGDAHRELLETIERRAQQVWIPVTVATLVPGVIFLAVPFVEAMRLFAGS